MQHKNSGHAQADFRLAVTDHAPCRPTSTVRLRLRLPTSASTLTSSGPCHTAAVDGRSQEESWTDRQRHSLMSNITAAIHAAQTANFSC